MVNKIIISIVLVVLMSHPARGIENPLAVFLRSILLFEKQQVGRNNEGFAACGITAVVSAAY